MTLTLRRKCAFTLAEVLITLSILGVVAAITIPSIYQSYKKAIVQTNLKIAYSTLSNAINISEAINGNAERWDWCTYSGNSLAEHYILPYINGTRMSLPTANWNNNDVKTRNPIARTQGLNGELWEAGPHNWGFSGGIWLKLKNGTDVLILRGIHGVWNQTVRFFVDINGFEKGNNVVGKEVFMFSLVVRCNSMNCDAIRRNERAFFTPDYANVLQLTENARTIENAMGTGHGGCNMNAATGKDTPRGSLCSYVIYKNGWKIPKDYPIKNF